MLMRRNTGNRWRSDGASDAAKCKDHEYGICAWEYGARAFCNNTRGGVVLQSDGGWVGGANLASLVNHFLHFH